MSDRLASLVRWLNLNKNDTKDALKQLAIDDGKWSADDVDAAYAQLDAGQYGLEYRGAWIRLLANTLDTLIFLAINLGIVFLALAIFLFSTKQTTSDILLSTSAFLQFLGTGGILFIYLFILLQGIGYPLSILITEWRYGTTIGKRICKLTVVTEEGNRISFKAALIRNFLRVVDYGVLTPILGMILTALSKKKQRLGDRLAKTIVITQ